MVSSSTCTTQGNGSHCEDVDECDAAQPCHRDAACINEYPGFRCGPCPRGYEGSELRGVGLDFARSARQHCRDVDECADGQNGGCVPHSRCINTPGSRWVTARPLGLSCSARQDSKKDSPREGHGYKGVT